VTITIADLLARAEARHRAAERDAADAKAALKRFIDLQDAAGVENITDPAALQRIDALVLANREARGELTAASGALNEIRAAAADDAVMTARSAEQYPSGAPSPAGRESAHDIGRGRTAAALPGGESPWLRSSDGRRAALARGQSWRDHEVVAEYAARAAAQERPVLETYGGIGQLVRAMTTSSGSAIVPTLWSSRIIDRARNLAQVLAAGCEVVPMDSKVLQIGRLTTDVAAAFRAEGSAITPADPVFDSAQLTATSLTCLTVASLEFMQDAVNADATIEEAIAKSMALALDLNCIYGGITTGAEGVSLATPPNVRGILANLLANLAGNVLGSGTNGTAITAATPWNEVLATIYQVRRGNEVPNALLWPVRLQQGFAQRYDTLNQPLRQPDDVASIMKLSTNQLASGMTQGTGTNMCDLVAGDFTKAILGQRMDFAIRVLTERFADNGQIAILSYWRGDFQLARPGAFCFYRYLAGV